MSTQNVELTEMQRLALMIETCRAGLPEGVRIFEMDGRAIFPVWDDAKGVETGYGVTVQGDFVIEAERKIINVPIEFDKDREYSPEEVLSILTGAVRKILHFKETVLEKKVLPLLCPECGSNEPGRHLFVKPSEICLNSWHSPNKDMIGDR